jgi:hypothetical protein
MNTSLALFHRFPPRESIKQAHMPHQKKKNNEIQRKYRGCILREENIKSPSRWVFIIPAQWVLFRLTKVGTFSFSFTL